MKSISFYRFDNADWCLSLSISLSIRIVPISFKPVFFISVYSLYIHLYLFLSLVYPPLSLSISLTMQINAYLFLSLYQSGLMPISFKPVFLSQSILHISTYICFYLLSIHLYFFIPLCQFGVMPISFYLFINPDWCLYLLNLFSLSQSILCISTYIFFYLLSIHLYFFIPLCQFGLMPISFNPIFFISAWSSCTHLYLFSSLFYLPLSLSISCLSKCTYISFNPLLLI